MLCRDLEKHFLIQNWWKWRLKKTSWSARLFFVLWVFSWHIKIPVRSFLYSTSQSESVSARGYSRVVRVANQQHQNFFAFCLCSVRRVLFQGQTKSLHCSICWFIEMVAYVLSNSSNLWWITSLPRVLKYYLLMLKAAILSFGFKTKRTKFLVNRNERYNFLRQVGQGWNRYLLFYNLQGKLITRTQQED